MKISKWGAIAIAATMLIGGACLAAAQESVVYSFNPGSTDGQSPNGGVAIDKEGNLYGTTATGGTHGSGIVYELSPPSQPGGDWTETVIYNFGDVPAAGGSPGITGQGGSIIIDNSGNLYGTAPGGVSNVSGELASGVVYELSPPLSGSGEWTAQALYTFVDDSSQPTQLKGPNGAVVLDANGNVYGIAYGGGTYGNGGVYELSAPAQAGGAWTMTPLYSFNNSVEAGQPYGPGANASPIVDAKGNLYGTTQFGGAENSGTVYELSPPTGGSGSWTASILHSFKLNFAKDGYGPLGSLAMDDQGDLFGTTGAQGLYDGGIVFELLQPASAGGQWTEVTPDNFTAFSKTDGYGPFANVVLDNQSNVWGATYWGGPNGDGDGAIFELMPVPGGGWSEATPVPYFFGAHANDAYHSNNPIVIDGKGNLYSAGTGGANNCDGTPCGAVWEYIPPAPVITLAFGPNPGTYDLPVPVSIVPSLKGALVYYTTDGQTPTTASTLYKDAIHVTRNTTIKAIAVNNTDESKIYTAVYTILAAKPVFSPPGNTYATAREVTISDTTPGAVIHYTINGEAPTASSPVYSKGQLIKIATDETVSAIAIATGYGNSPVAKAAYEIETPAPSITPDGGTFTKATTVTLKNATAAAGATIYYTTNNTTPTKYSTKYTKPFTVSAKKSVVKAIAQEAGHAPSAVESATFTIE